MSASKTMSGDFKLRSSKRLCTNQNPSYSPIKTSKYYSSGNRTDRNSNYVSKPESKQSVYKKHQSHGDSREVTSLTEHINEEVISGSAKYSPKFLKSMSSISRNKRSSTHKEVTNNIRQLRNQRYHNQLESDHPPQTKEKIKHHKSEENVQSKITDLYCTKKSPRSPKATQTLVKENEEKTRNSSEKDKSFPFPSQPSYRQVGNISNSKFDNRKLEHSYASTKNTPVKTSKQVNAGKECDFIIRRSPRFKQSMADDIYSKQSVAPQHKSMKEGTSSMKTKHDTKSSIPDIHPNDSVLLKSQTIHPPLKSTQYGLPGLFNQWPPKSKQNPTIAAIIKNTINKFNVDRKSLDRKELPTNYKSSDVKTSIKNPKGDRISLEDKASLSKTCKSNDVKLFTNTGTSKSDRKLLEAFDASNHGKPRTFVDTSMNKIEVIIAPRRSPRIKIENNSSLQLANNRQSSLLTSKTMQNNQLPTSHGHRLQNVIRKISPDKQIILSQTVPSQILNQLSMKLQSPRKQNKPRQETQPTRKSPRFSDAGRSFTTGLCLPTGKQIHTEYTILKSHEKLSSGMNDLKDRSGGTDCSKSGNDIHSKKEIADVKSQEFSEKNDLTATDHEKEIRSPLNSRNVRRKIEFVSKQTSDNKTIAGKDDDSDDEYIPRRKKLRSEVTESELWEGFPPNIRFKRLTPKKKVNIEIVPKQNSSVYDINQTKVSHDRMFIQSNEKKGNITNDGKSDTKGNVYSVDNDVQEKDNTKGIESNDHQANKIDVTGMETESEKHRGENVSDVSDIAKKDGGDILDKLDKDIDKVYDGVNDDHIVEKLATAEHKHVTTQNSENKVCDQKEMKVDQWNKDENEIIRKHSNENTKQIFDVNITSKGNGPKTTDDTPITKVDSKNPSDESTVANLDNSTKKAEMPGYASSASTPKRKKESFLNVTPKRSARLQKKIGSSKKNDVYVYTPLKRHENLDEKKSKSDDKSNKITNYTSDVENVKRKRKTNSVFKFDENDLTEEPAANEIKDSKSLLENNETENYAGKVNDKKKKEGTELPCTKNIVEEEKLQHNNSDADDKLSKSITERCDEVCEQVQTNHDNENTEAINSVSVITITREKNLKENEELATESSLKSICHSKLVDECPATQKFNTTCIEEPSNIQDITERTLEEGKHRTENVETSLTTKRQMTKEENIVDLQCEKKYDVEELKDGVANKSSKNEQSDKVKTETINNIDDKGCSYKEELKEITAEITTDERQRESIKITMKKTKNGAAIIHPKPNNSPFVLLPRISIPTTASILQSDEWKGENKILSGTKNPKKDKNKGKSTITTTTTKKSKLSDNRQLRSSEECDELRLETTPELERTKKSGKVFKQRKRKSNEKSPLKKSKRRVSSPKKSDAMRKKDDAQCLLANKALEKHACILWSSGQRRHFQMSNPEASHNEIDDIMRKAWDQMLDKEKLGYFIRAKNAMTDEYKHSTPKKREIPEKLPEIKECKKMLKFMSLSPSAQHEELQKWLRLFYEISAGEYSKLMLDFKEVLKQKRSELKDKYKENFKQKDAEYQSFYRKLLFRKILDVRNKIVGIYEQKIERQEIILKEAFDNTVRQLIAGEDIEFPKSERSEALSEVLLDLKDLESDLKIAVSGAPISTKSFENVLDGLQQELDDVNSKAEDRKEAADQEDLKEPDSNYAEQLLIQSSTTELPVLEVSLVDAILNNESEGNAECLVDDQARELFLELSKFFDREAVNAYDRLQKENDKQCCELNNPSCLLTNWMLSDQFHALSRPINQMTRNDRMLVDSKQLVQFLKGTGPYNVVALPASTIPPNMRRAGVRRNYNNNGKITTTCSYNNNNSNNNNNNNLNIRMLETQRSRPVISTMPYTSRANTVQKSGIPRIVQTRIPSLPGHTLLRFTSTSNGNIRIQTSPPTH